MLIKYTTKIVICIGLLWAVSFCYKSLFLLNTKQAWNVKGDFVRSQPFLVDLPFQSCSSWHFYIPQTITTLFCFPSSTLSSGLSSLSALFWADLVKPHVKPMTEFRATVIAKLAGKIRVEYQSHADQIFHPRLLLQEWDFQRCYSLRFS